MIKIISIFYVDNLSTTARKIFRTYFETLKPNLTLQIRKLYFL